MVRLIVRDRETIQEAVRRFRKLVERSGIKKEMRRREYYEKPSEIKRRARLRAERDPVACDCFPAEHSAVARNTPKAPRWMRAVRGFAPHMHKAFAASVDDVPGLASILRAQQRPAPARESRTRGLSISHISC